MQRKRAGLLQETRKQSGAALCSHTEGQEKAPTHHPPEEDKEHIWPFSSETGHFFSLSLSSFNKAADLGLLKAPVWEVLSCSLVTWAQVGWVSSPFLPFPELC